ncbi:hypothetical protein I8748_20155 [Nostoc sp. CENA67]|uniref:SWIM-type domain-containing protein n=1 Tax=Amazonocrinis nigriterrae CENA67 TaxID=2794033 RepID=A0A8J7HWB3_9NOST|nr:hypothetical protein [Amazonocrinis nigriterrae]MBH8564467.1 hypothetical protein [Amazonocrinis nigriterrae CENA67]
MKVSRQLQSQVFSNQLIAELLIRLGRTKWMEKYNVHDLHCEAWAVGIWVKQAGIISYKDLANFWRETAAAIGEFLPAEKLDFGWLVKSMKSDKRYFVHFSRFTGWFCNCMKFKCWHNRISEEMPQFYKALNSKIFCHHVAAAYQMR